MPENLAPELGRRIADLRAKRGWTQNDLAARLGVSRTAVSHAEAGMSIPGERTVALMAGLFSLEPHELVEGTDYPSAKSERLPVVVTRYTEVEHQLALLERDLAWLDRTGGADREEVLAGWRSRLAALLADTHDPEERTLVMSRRSEVASAPLATVDVPRAVVPDVTQTPKTIHTQKRQRSRGDLRPRGVTRPGVGYVYGE